MPTITTQAGPWNMTVYAFAEEDAENPLFRAGNDDVARMPFGAVELDRSGKVVTYNDTDPMTAGRRGRPWSGAISLPRFCGTPLTRWYIAVFAMGWPAATLTWCSIARCRGCPTRCESTSRSARFSGPSGSLSRSWRAAQNRVRPPSFSSRSISSIETKVGQAISRRRAR